MPDDNRPGHDALFDDDRTDAAAQGLAISRLQPTARDPSRLSVLVNGRRVATLPARCMHDLDLYVGLAWTPDVEARVTAASQQDEVHRRALRMLNRRALSSGEVRDRLIRRHGAASEVVDRVIADLQRIGLLDDAGYGRMVLRDLTASGRKPAGAALMRSKLRQRRLESALIEELVTEARASSDPDAEIASLIEVRLGRMERLDSATRYRRLYSYLARRGFESERITSALKARLRELDD
ncbi:MAG: hypothetical protein HND57_13140 [Planctomycetes bacterium]|nr:hypothetical protein [Planctomycetota bacterium]